MKNRIIKSLWMGLALTTIFLSGCATSKKGPSQVYARPAVREVSPINQAITAAPRTTPGKLMDPSAVTYAQVPSRIIYFPGSHGIFSRNSASQAVAYNLVPVDRIPEIQAENTPEFGAVTQSKEEKRGSKDIIETSFMEADGSMVKGTARRLGVLGQNEIEKERAMNLLKKEEELRWSADMGWVGFIAERKARPYKPKVKEDKPIPVDTTPDVQEKKPEIEPISSNLGGWGTPESESKKEVPATLDSDADKKGTPPAPSTATDEEEISLDIEEDLPEVDAKIEIKENN